MTKHISVKGVTHGVGFAPFVYGLATRLNLYGWVRNTMNGAEVVVQGSTENIEAFIYCLKAEALSAARIDHLEIVDAVNEAAYVKFEIRPSIDTEDDYQPISPDMAICPDCERELFDPRNPRYLYPFISCAHCGPRFTIGRDIPYNRRNTTMAEFEMCERCEVEYSDPTDRRFSAESIACPNCGPFVSMREVHSPFTNLSSRISSIECRDAAVLKARRLLSEGYILAVKGLGGFHLVCDASNAFTVEELRDRKGRVDKPFAVMAANIATVKSVCDMSIEEHILLTSREKPITILQKKNGIDQPGYLSKWVAPHLDTLGVMLPYTGLHHLLLNQTDPMLKSVPVPPLLVMTSGNYREEPIAITDEEALQRLSPLADAFLLYNRDIYVRCDDSVARVDHERSNENNGYRSPTIYLRRSRGYVPQPVKLPVEIKPTLAVGGEIKNAFCIARGHNAYLSHHIGDLVNVETCEAFEQGVEHLSRILRIQPETIAHDLNPDYFTTQYIKRSNVQGVGVQHHHAHIASCMSDNGLDNRRLIGLSFDGGGCGIDGAIWGGDALLASFADFERFARLEYLPLPNVNLVTPSPWRIAVGYAHALDIEISDLPFLHKVDQESLHLFRQQISTATQTRFTSSVGRLLDAVASLAGVCNEVTYEGQAAMEMETLSRPFVASASPYPYHFEENSPSGNDARIVVRIQEILSSVVQDIHANVSAEIIGARFHKTIAEIGLDMCRQARSQTKLNEVALSGGSWQNQILLHLVRTGLKKEGFTVYSHQQVPTNDGGLALGQTVIANCSHGTKQVISIAVDGKTSSTSM